MLREAVLAASIFGAAVTGSAAQHDLHVCRDDPELQAPVASHLEAGFDDAQRFFDDHSIDVQETNRFAYDAS